MIIREIVICIGLLISGVFTQNLMDEEHEECLTDIDLIILLDGSFSVKRSNFNIVKQWVKQLAEGMHIGHGHIQIGVVQYSHYYNDKPLNGQRYIKTEIELGEYTNQEDFDRAVDRIRYQGYKTYTAHAINKTVNYDFLGANNRYPQAKRALILLTDGKATDSANLPPVIEHAEKDRGVIIYAVGVGKYSLSELKLITHYHDDRVFELESFEGLNSIVNGLQFQLETVCDCDLDGSVSEDCEACTKQCPCKPNVVGRRCDSCANSTYNFGSTGCEECGCNPFGTLDPTDCDVITGQCNCRSGEITGRACDKCRDGNFGFPECRPCQCGGHAVSCHQATGVCESCNGNRTGDHCERCMAGHYMLAGECTPCNCNGNIQVSDPDACDATSGECLKCLHNTRGPQCAECIDSYFGDATTQSCTKCQCDLSGTDPSTCVGGDCGCASDGSCTCLPHVVGRNCGKCSSGSWRSSRGCVRCECSQVGTVTNSTCDKVTGQCRCHSQYTGKSCGSCAAGYLTNEGGECTEPEPTEPATTTTAKPAKIRKRPTPIPVNPGWSPCVSCGGKKWPSYCHGRMCRRRWPYHQFYPSPRRCYSGNWGCRATMSYHQQYNPTYSTNYRSYHRNYYNRVEPSYIRRPTYYRGYYNHQRTYNGYRSNVRSAQPIRYGLYRS